MTGPEVVPNVDPLLVEELSPPAAAGVPRLVVESAQPCAEATAVVPASLLAFAASAGGEPCPPGGVKIPIDPTPAVVVTTGVDEGVVTETVVTGVAAITVVVVGIVTETVVTGVVAVAVVGTAPVVGIVVTVGTVVGAVVGTGTVVSGSTAVPPGGAAASTFATKKPTTPKATSRTIVL